MNDYQNAIKEIVDRCNAAKDRGEKSTIKLNMSLDERQLFEAARDDMKFPTLTSWVLHALNLAAKAQLGVYTVLDYDSHYAPIANATRTELDAHNEEALKHGRAWSWRQGKRVVIR